MKNVFMKKQKKLLTIVNAHDNMNELRVKHVTAKAKRSSQQSCSLSAVAE